MTPLRNKMADDLRLRNISEGTSEVYLRCVARLATYHRLSPDKLGAQDVREYLLGLDLAGRAPATRAVYHSALKFFFDNLRLVQILLGHSSPVTTARYAQVHANTIANTPSPYDQL